MTRTILTKISKATQEQESSIPLPSSLISLWAGESQHLHQGQQNFTLNMGSHHPHREQHFLMVQEWVGRLGTFAVALVV